MTAPTPESYWVTPRLLAGKYPGAILDRDARTELSVREALDTIEDASDRGVVYLHCRGGCGRTGVIIGCYLVEQGLRPDDALERVHELTRALWSKPCPETPEQIEMVCTWATGGGQACGRRRSFRQGS